MELEDGRGLGMFSEPLRVAFPEIWKQLTAEQRDAIVEQIEARREVTPTKKQALRKGLRVISTLIKQGPPEDYELPPESEPKPTVLVVPIEEEEVPLHETFGNILAKETQAPGARSLLQGFLTKVEDEPVEYTRTPPVEVSRSANSGTVWLLLRTSKSADDVINASCIVNGQTIRNLDKVHFFPLDKTGKPVTLNKDTSDGRVLFAWILRAEDGLLLKYYVNNAKSPLKKTSKGDIVSKYRYYVYVQLNNMLREIYESEYVERLNASRGEVAL